MAHKKLFRFAAIKSFPNVLQYPAGMPGKWNEFFKNNNAIILELACGKGEYAVGLAQLHPDKNFIGVDLKGNRMYVGAKKCLDHEISNVAFLRTQIDKITDYFAPAEVSEIWITFPDPFLRDSKAKNRLTHHRFLYLYHQILPKGAKINLKTDSTELYDFTLQTIEELGCTIHINSADVYADHIEGPVISVQTYYEGLHLMENKKIKYIQFSLPGDLAPYIKKKKVIDDGESHAG